MASIKSVVKLVCWLAVAGLSSVSLACRADEPATEAVPAVQQPQQPLQPQQLLQMDWQGLAQEVLINAMSLTGVKYHYGGTSPDTGFDCSGFVRYVFQQATNLTLPHGARAISQLGQAITVDQLQPGDLVFYHTLKSAFSHVGIYIGDNRFIHAPTNGGGVHVVNMADAYWAKRFNGARRMVLPSTQPPAESSAE